MDIEGVNNLNQRALDDLRRHIEHRISFNIMCIKLEHQKRAMTRKIERRRANRQNTYLEEDELDTLNGEGRTLRMLLRNTRQNLRRYGPIAEDMYIEARNQYLQRNSFDIIRELQEVDREINGEDNRIENDYINENIDFCDYIPEENLVDDSDDSDEWSFSDDDEEEDVNEMSLDAMNLD